MTQPQPPIFFDRALYVQRRNKAAASYAEVEFLKLEASERLVDILEDFVRKDFGVVIELGAHHGQLSQLLQQRKGIETAMLMDTSVGMLQRAACHAGARGVVGDEEWLPLLPASVDLVVSALSLHMVNDLVGVLVQIRRALRAGGCMVVNMVGGNSLTELRQCFAQAEAELLGGVSPRIIPMIDVRDAGDILARTGFSLPVADSETLTITYPDMWALVKDLKAMGATNMLSARSCKVGRRDVFVRAAELYRQLFSDEEGRIKVTIDLISMIGWTEEKITKE